MGVSEDTGRKKSGPNYSDNRVDICPGELRCPIKAPGNVEIDVMKSTGRAAALAGLLGLFAGVLGIGAGLWEVGVCAAGIDLAMGELAGKVPVLVGTRGVRGGATGGLVVVDGSLVGVVVGWWSRMCVWSGNLGSGNPRFGNLGFGRLGSGHEGIRCRQDKTGDQCSAHPQGGLKTGWPGGRAC